MSRESDIRLIHSEGGISDHSAEYDQRLAQARDALGSCKAAIITLQADGDDEREFHTYYLKKDGVDSCEFLPAAVQAGIYTAERILTGEFS